LTNLFLFKWLKVTLAVALLSSIVSMMAAFAGSEGIDLRDLLELQVLLLPRMRTSINRL
jgi:hypothetical protein